MTIIDKQINKLPQQIIFVKNVLYQIKDLE